MNDYFVSYVTKDPITVYRVWGEGAAVQGRWYFTQGTKTLINTSEDAKIVLKLHNNAAVNMAKFEIPAGTRVYVGGIKGGSNSAIQIYTDYEYVKNIKQIGSVIKLK